MKIKYRCSLKRRNKFLLLTILSFAFTYVSNAQISTAGLVAYYPFSGNANDVSGLNNNPVFNSATLTADRFGAANSAYLFNGTNNYMQVSNSPSLQISNQMSICAWVKPLGYYTGTCYNNMLIMKGGEGSPNNFFMRFADIVNGCTSPNINNEQFYAGGGGSGTTVAPAPLVQLNQWYSVVWTYDGSNARLYVNCILRATTPATSLSFINSADMFLGRMNDPVNPGFPYWLNGVLDEIRIYSRPLTQSEVNIYGDCSTCPSAVSITAQPTSVSVCAGSNASFTVGVSGASTYQWQVSTNGGTSFTDISGVTSATLNLTGVTAAMNNYQYHVIVSNSCPGTIPVTSSNATLTVQSAPAIITQPASVTACTGSTSTLSVVATGTGLTYQWQSASSCGGVFTNISGSTSSSYNAPTAVAGVVAYRVIVSGTCTPNITSACVTVTLAPTTSISTQPLSVAACSGNNVSFTVAASGATSYQWQVSTNGGTTFSDIAGAASPILTLTAVAVGMNNNQYRVIINGCPSPLTSNAATLTIQTSAAITVQPASTISCSSSASFTVTATGTNLSYQWQVSTDGGVTYNNIPGATSATLTLNALTLATANYRYRVIVSSAACGSSVTSTGVTANVGVPPSVVLTAAQGTSFNPSISGGLYTTISPVGNYTYQWKRDGEILTNFTGASVTTANGLLLCFGTYQVTATDVSTGCSTSSNIVTVSDIPGGRSTLYLSPNPAKNVVKMSFYSSSCTASQVRRVIVYDSKGARVLTKDFTVTGTYGAMNLDISKLSQGTYMIVLTDAGGTKIASEGIIKF